MNKSLARPLMMAFGVTFLLIAAAMVLTPSTTADELPPAEAAGQANAVIPQEGCELLQTIQYARCGHTVVRRFAAPVEVQGQQLEAVQALYPDFTERQVGLRRFSDVLRTLERESLLTLKTDESGNMLVQIL